MPAVVAWNASRCKVQIKLSTQRLRTLQEKKLALAKKIRRDIADLVQKGRIETAKLRVESLIQDDIYVELLELLELYTETLSARFGLLDASMGEKPDQSISDAVCAIIYAAPRTELRELQVLREILMHKFGRNFSLSLLPSDPPPAAVPPRISSKLALYTPSADLVDAYLAEIARGYGVPYLTALDMDAMDDAADLDTEGGDGEGDNGGDGDKSSGSGGSGGAKETAAKEKTAVKEKTPEAKETPAPVVPRGPTVVKKATEEDELAARFAKLKSLR